MREAAAFFYVPNDDDDAAAQQIMNIFGLEQKQAEELVKYSSNRIAAQESKATGRQLAEGRPMLPAAGPDAGMAPAGVPPKQAKNTVQHDNGKDPQDIRGPVPNSPQGQAVARAAASPSKSDLELDELVKRVTTGHSAALAIVDEVGELSSYQPLDLGLKLGENFPLNRPSDVSAIANTILQRKSIIGEEWCVEFFRGFARGLKKDRKGGTAVQNNDIRQQIQSLRDRLKLDPNLYQIQLAFEAAWKQTAASKPGESWYNLSL